MIYLLKAHFFVLFWVFLTQYIMELTFTQAAKGVNKEISVNIEAPCQRCDGKGHEPGTKVQHCHFCNGSGMVKSLTRRVPSKCICVVLLNLCIRIPVGDCEHGPLCDALHLSSLWWQRHSHLQPLSLLPWEGTDQAKEECDGSCACWSVTLNCLYLMGVFFVLLVPIDAY